MNGNIFRVLKSKAIVLPHYFHCMEMSITNAKKSPFGLHRTKTCTGLKQHEDVLIMSKWQFSFSFGVNKLFGKETLIFWKQHINWSLYLVLRFGPWMVGEVVAHVSDHKLAVFNAGFRTQNKMTLERLHMNWHWTVTPHNWPKLTWLSAEHLRHREHTGYKCWVLNCRL